jgi:hypothetical protein
MVGIEQGTQTELDWKHIANFGGRQTGPHPLAARVVTLEGENEQLQAEVARLRAELEPLKEMAVEFGAMEPRIAAMQEEVSQKDEELESIKLQLQDMEGLKRKVMSYDALKRQNNQLEELTTGLSEEKREVITQMTGYKTELGKANGEIESLLGKLKGAKHELLLARSGKREDPDAKEAQAKLGWVNKIQRAALSSKSQEAALLRQESTRLTARLLDDEAMLARAKAEATEAAAKAVQRTNDLHAQFMAMAEKRDAEFNSEREHIQHLHECCAKLEEYALKEHQKWKQEHKVRMQLQHHLAELQNEHNAKAGLVHSLHDQLKAAEDLAAAALGK